LPAYNLDTNKLYNKKELFLMRSDHANGSILTLFFLLILLALLFLVFIPAFCKAAPPTPQGWGPDYCLYFR
jgi:hypothetical protein